MSTLCNAIVWLWLVFGTIVYFWQFRPLAGQILSSLTR